MKNLLLISLFICLYFPVYGQSNNWMISTDISTLSRSGNERVLNNPTGSNFEWRNRVGFKLGEQTMLGLSASYRQYDLEEIADYGGSDFRSRYDYKINNQLLGLGTFLTQYYHISLRFHLQTTVYAQIEQGEGKYESNDFGGGGLLVTIVPGPPENTTFRERNFFAGVEFGASYFITSRWIIQTNINLLQYENFRNSSAALHRTPSESTRPLEQEGSGFSFLTDRAIINLGVMVLLGKR